MTFEKWQKNTLHEKCAVMALYTPSQPAARLTYFGLSALQHRGQESSGIISSTGREFFAHGGAGLVAQVYKESDLQMMKGNMAIGHNRYATSGQKHDRHIQPIHRGDDVMAFAHNGNIHSTVALKKFLRSKKLLKAGTNDSEMMADAIRYYIYTGSTPDEAIKASWPLFTGAFSCVMMTRDAIYAFRDKYGIRPLSLGKLGRTGYVVASETCAFDMLGARFVRDIAPGELVEVSKKGFKKWQIEPSELKLEIFEFIYFARPDSVLQGKLVNEARRRLGRKLAREHPIKRGIVVPVPDSSIPAALGYASGCSLEFDHGLIKNRYIHRSFIEPTQELRERAVAMKLNPLATHLRGKDVILIDDSIVRGTTTKQIVKMLRGVGVKSVHIRVSSPPVKYPDFYGIDTPNQDKLIAFRKSVSEICKHVGADSLEFLSYDGMIEAIGLPEDQLCTACFSGNYPIDLLDRAKEVKIPPSTLSS